MSRKLTIAILDSGVETEHQLFQNCHMETYEYQPEDNSWIQKYTPPLEGHGTAVASVLVKQVKPIREDIEIISFKIFDTQTETNPEILISALRFILARNLCDVINISAGIGQDISELEEVCNQLDAAGVLVVAAFSNDGLVSYPAAYDTVVGVDVTTSLTTYQDHIYVENSMVNIGMASGNQRVAWLGQRYVIDSGTSFVAPLVTAKICGALWEGIQKEDMLSFLKNSATKVISFEMSQEPIPKLFPIKKAAVFPVNKETANLLHYAHLLPFQIEGVYATHSSGKIGLTLSSRYNDMHYTIQRIEQCDMEGIDTFILGHTVQLCQQSGVDYEKMIIDRCIAKGINVVAFDSIAHKYLTQGKMEIYTPSVFRNRYSTNKFGRLYDVYSPVLAVVGTSSQQGKFTLQLRLRELFLNDQYDIRQLSTEPNGELFGMDATFPYGYFGAVDLRDLETVEYVNYLMHTLDQKNPDIILAGAQSGLCTLSFNNLTTYNLESIKYVLGVKPDAVVLCVNYHDTMDMIVRSIQFVQSLVPCTVVAISVFSLAFENEWQAKRNVKKQVPEQDLRAFCQSVHNNTRIKCFRLGNESDEKALYQCCIDFFAEG